MNTNVREVYIFENLATGDRQPCGHKTQCLTGAIIRSFKFPRPSPWYINFSIAPPISYEIIREKARRLIAAAMYFSTL